MLRSPVVVGRDRELEAIRRALDDASAGQGGCLFLLGEAGSGKTRLLREAREETRRRGMGVLAGSVPPAVASPAFGVLAQALRSWTRSHPVPEAELAPFALGLHQVLPEWPLPSDLPDLAADQVRLLVLEGILRLLLAAARDKGALVLLDDLHDADPETFDFLHHAGDAIGFERLLILGAVRSREHRPGEVRARALVRGGQATAVEVGHLDDAGVAGMVEAVLEVPPPPELIVDLLARTDGVPLLVEEMLVAHLAVGTLRRENGSMIWTTEAEARAIVPETILEIVRERLAGLADDDRGPLFAGAVLGRFEPHVLAAVTGLDPAILAARLQPAVERGFLEPAGPTVAFRHALIRDAVVESVPHLDRMELHRRAADALDSLHGDDAERLEERAHHREAIGQVDIAAQLLVEAAHRSLARHGPASAEVALRRAIELARLATTADAARDLLVETLGTLGRWDEALGLDRQLLASQGDSASRLLRMARNAIWSGRLDEAEALIAQAASAGAEPPRLAVLSALLGLWRGDLEAATEGGRAALELAEAAGDTELACSALDVAGRALASMGSSEEAAGMFRRWAALAEGAGLPMSRLQALLELGIVELMAGNPPEELRAVRGLARELGAYTASVLASLTLTWSLRYHGQLEEAIEIGEEAVALCRRFRLDVLPHALASLGNSLNLRSRDGGEALLSEAQALAPGDDDVLVVTESSRGENDLRAGRLVEAEGHLARATGTMQRVPSAVQAPAPFQRIGVLLALGREEEARVALEEARGLPGGKKVYYLPIWLAVAEALVAGSSAGVEEALAPAAESMPQQRAVALVLGAEVLGGPSAPDWLREALAIFESAGAYDDATRMRQLLRQMGERAPRGRETPGRSKVARPKVARPTERRERKTFMFTDIVGSTNLVEMLGDEAWGHLLRWHDQTLRTLFAEGGGEEAKQIGDGFFVAFDRPASALECAVAIQRALAVHRQDHGFAPQVRIGVHEAEATRKGTDYEGKGVHEAARIGALANGGEVVASRGTVGRLRRFRTSEPRTVQLKGISDPVQVVTIGW